MRYGYCRTSKPKQSIERQIRNIKAAYFKMKLGNLFIRIHPDTYDGTGCIVVSAELAFGTGQNLKFLNPDTLQDDFDALERHCKRTQRDELKDWVLTNGADYCCGEVKRIWERG